MLNRKGCKFLADAIRRGLRERDLAQPLFEDCRAWMWARPDVWPSPTDFPPIPSHRAPQISAHAPVVGTEVSSIEACPLEVLTTILVYLPLSSIFSLSSACKSLHRTISTPSSLNYVIRESVLSSSTSTSLRWILPVDAIPGEVSRAYKIAKKWLSESAYERNGADIDNPFAHPSFPWIAFMKSCAQSWSMLNRKRLWGIAKQYDELWRYYRIHGWEVDRFAK